MHEPNRVRKSTPSFNVTLNEEQKEAKRAILENQIIVITGRAGSGKSLVAANGALTFLETGQTSNIFVTRATVEVGDSLGFLPGDMNNKFNPYTEALVDNLKKCIDSEKVDKYIEKGAILGMPVQFVRGKTMDEVLIVEEAQNLTEHQMIAILTRLGKTGKIIITGDFDQQDISIANTGLHFAVALAKRFPSEVALVKLTENHRSDLVGSIIDFVYERKNKTEAYGKL